MKTYRLAFTLAAALALGVSIIAIGRGTAAPAPAAPQGGGLTVLDFRPAFDDQMTMLVQPRHIKLYAAGQAKNWMLAGFQLNELRASLRRIGQTIPKYRTFEVDNAVATIFTPAVQKMDAAIKSADSAQFASAFAELTTACNACHQGMEHPFLKIRVPDAAAMQPYINQDFSPDEK